jgi:hypothetical protein
MREGRVAVARLDRSITGEQSVSVGTVERAYQLAPECRTIAELRDRLTKERCDNVDSYLRGSLRSELSKLLKKSS